MTEENSRIGVYRVLTLLMGIFLVAAIGGLCLVWLRQEITGQAEEIRDRKSKVTVLNRRLRTLEAKVAIANQPEFLKLSAEARGMGLTIPETRRMVYMWDGDGKDPSSEKPSRESFAIAYDFAGTGAAGGDGGR